MLINKEKSETEKEQIYIPVSVDDVKNYSDFAMTRCSYFCVKSHVPNPDWTFALGENVNIPIIMTGLVGIIWRPAVDRSASEQNIIFDDPYLIEEIFEAIEKIPDFYVNTSEIWLPNDYFINYELKRGKIFRINYALFKKAYLFKRGKETQDSLKQYDLPSPAVTYSEIENKAFNLWSSKKIEEAKQLYPKVKERALKWY